ncbi:hypothetical protein PAAG_06127 [Paracoccidioides lutzii Pb01]|uniref:Uncharacterized protein n=1 Tax=Paracoccidioides lutzii (strain ATCC MYA-826 / Pb01) TaxID=502779 RepID=C1H617_PARBA|nr:hypothetical protein PAAG_06127 [Paracoccidioides lutzii Pb01]EEH35080.2 hypothetical protein PAAG_06127 [Paracoccidioides lutzii Pb01]
MARVAELEANMGGGGGGLVLDGHGSHNAELCASVASTNGSRAKSPGTKGGRRSLEVGRRKKGSSALAT